MQTLPLDHPITKKVKITSLKLPKNYDGYPIAVVLDAGCPDRGRLICIRQQGGRFSYSIEELKKINPPWLVDGYVENLTNDFLKWLSVQEIKYSSPKEPGLQPTDLLPYNVQKNDSNLEWLVPAPDTRKLEDYLEIEIEPFKTPHPAPRTNCTDSQKMKQCPAVSPQHAPVTYGPEEKTVPINVSSVKKSEQPHRQKSLNSPLSLKMIHMENDPNEVFFITRRQLDNLIVNPSVSNQEKALLGTCIATKQTLMIFATPGENGEPTINLQHINDPFFPPSATPLRTDSGKPTNCLGSRVIELKTDPQCFDLVWTGMKPFEIRSTKDREFHSGDILWLREYSRETKKYSGRTLRALVLSVLNGPAYGIPPNHCVMGLYLDMIRAEVEFKKDQRM